MSPSIMRLALPVLAAAGSVYAASCSSDKALTISSSNDVPSGCDDDTYTGDIIVSSDAGNNIQIDGLAKIDGSLTLGDNPNIHQLSASDLKEITGTFNVSNVQVLDTLDFPKLTNVDELILTGLPALRQLGFTTTVQEANSIDIENTHLTSLTGINVTEAATIKIANNGLLDTIDLPVTEITDIIELSDNNIAVIVTLDELEKAQNLTFRNCSGVSLAKIESLNGTLAFFGSKFESFNASNLTTIGGALTIVDNNSLQNISFPTLKEVSGALEVANNTDLHQIDFPKLETIKGALDFHGNITNVSLPALDNVVGSFNIQSTGDIQGTCDNDFKKLKSSSKIQGPYTCVGKVENPGGEGSDPSSTGGSKPTNAASPLNVQGGAVFAGVMAAFFL